MLDPKLSALLKAATAEKRVAACLAGCEFAVNAAKIYGKAIDLSLDLLRRGQIISPSLKVQLDELTSQLDAQYLALQDEGSLEAITVFGQARAAAALSFASSVPQVDAVSDSLYEASATVDDPAQLFLHIRVVLEA